jgi:hypothetical protein
MRSSRSATGEAHRSWCGFTLVECVPRGKREYLRGTSSQAILHRRGFTKMVWLMG